MFGINLVFTLKIPGFLKLFPNNRKEKNCMIGEQNIFLLLFYLYRLNISLIVKCNMLFVKPFYVSYICFTNSEFYSTISETRKYIISLLYPLYFTHCDHFIRYSSALIPSPSLNKRRNKSSFRIPDSSIISFTGFAVNRSNSLAAVKRRFTI